jgi:2-aminobenzoate-CoA ligase
MTTTSNPPVASSHIDRFVIDRMPPPAQCAQVRYDSPELQIADQANVVVALLDQAVSTKGWADQPLMRSPHITLSYADALAHVNRIAQVLTEDLHLVPGNRVLLRGGNSIGMALAWLAVVKAGLVAVATMPLLRAKELCEIIDKAQPAVALCDYRLLDELELARQSAHDPSPSIATSTAPYTTPYSAHSTGPSPHSPLHTIIAFNQLDNPHGLAARAAQKSGVFTACATCADDPAMMAFTSGTTGKPKAAVHTHRDILAACEAWPRHVLQAKPSDIVVGSPPLAFTFGLGGLLIFPMWAGCSVYFPDAPYTPESMVDTINDIGGTICYTAPTFYRQMAAFAQAKGLATLRTSVSAGEGLPDATRLLWHEATGLHMLDGIGATELFHIFISSPGAQAAAQRGTLSHLGVPGTPIGKVAPGYTAKVVDDDGNELPRGTVGKLAVMGPTSCKYLDDARQINYVKNGWNYPGDAFLQNEAGFFFYQARADDMIISAGYNIGGPEVEDCLLKHAAVAECGVVGQPDDERGMFVKAVCVLRTGFDGDAAMVRTLQDHVKIHLAPYKYPRHIEFVTSLPRTETGKLQRFKLRQTV